jgi:hypothetical protein
MSSTLKESQIGCVCVGRGGGNSITNVLMAGGGGKNLTASTTKNVILGCCSGTCLGANGGGSNTFIGSCAGRCSDSQFYSTLIGAKAGCNGAGLYGVIIGTGTESVGNYSVKIGNFQSYNSPNEHSVTIGFCAGNNNYVNYGVVIGYCAGDAVPMTTTVVIGTCAGRNPTPYFEQSVIIGKEAFAIGTRAVAIGDYSRASQSAVAIGHLATADPYRVAVGYGATAGAENVWGNTCNNTYNCIWPAWSYTSDARDKWDVTPLSCDYGIPLLKKLKPVSFRWDHRETYVREKGMEFGQKDGTLVSERKDYGFIAQEVKESTDELNIKLPGIDKESDKYKLQYVNFLYTSIESIKQIIERVENLEEELIILENQ